MFKIKKKSNEEDVEVSVQSIYEGHHNVTYKGIKAIRCPFDYVIYQMIICELKPDLVIEIGTNIGGGALYIADLLDMNGKGILHTIDIVDIVDPRVKEHKRIKFFTKGWEDYNLELTQGFEKILIIEDASHYYKDTIGILNKFYSLVTLDSYFIIEDGIINELGLEKDYLGGPLKALREFLPNHPEFIVDRKWCNMFGKNATFNVNGYLKRI
ncbi:Cephalosporin hydroxylase [Flavobacterium fluvii]|uniref:Cephalosporin hydroxylase n=1 Tax=Flavobacterium fluvii TaxID=468056 RepID=A0A1M5IPL6_9FLAO|nr:CmcI family methyltransferase [Flavobacterium fluvii]SHG30237.1 Cephalosporin hydroxylase [Flavobacterium fluvii]